MTCIATFTLCIAAATPAQLPDIVDGNDVAAFVDPWIDAEIEAAHVPGVVFVLVTAERIVHGRGYGNATLEPRKPVDLDTAFRIGSLSKPITCILALQQVERGRLTLHDDIDDTLTEFKVGTAADPPVTLFHLLTHTAGFQESFVGQHLPRTDQLSPLGAWLSRHITQRVMPPGHVISYNDYGTTLAGHLVEQATGTDFGAHADRALFAPLGLAATTFDQSNRGITLARSYSWDGERHVACAVDAVQTLPAAGAFSSGRDMAMVLRLLLANGRVDGVRVLGAEAVQKMTTVQFRAAPGVQGRSFGFEEFERGDTRGLHKSGRASGFLARAVLLPDRGIGWFSAHNLSIFGPGPSLNRAARFHRDLGGALVDHFMPESRLEPTDEPPPLPGAAARAARYAGVYRNVTDPCGMLESALLVDEIEVTDAGGGNIEIGGAEHYEYAAGRLRRRGSARECAFLDDDRGEPEFLLLGAGAYRRLAWFETRATHLRTLLACGAAFATYLLLATVAFARRARKRRPPCTAHEICALALVTVHAAFPIAGWLYLSRVDLEVLLFHPPSLSIIALMMLPWAAAALLPVLAGALLRTVLVRRGGVWSCRVAAVVLIAATIASATHYQMGLLAPLT